MAVFDAEKEAKKMSEEARRQSDELNRSVGRPPELSPESLEAGRAGDIRDGDRAVGADGRVSPENAPADPTVRPENTNTGTPPPAQAPTRPNAEAIRASIVSPMLTPAEFKEKAKNFAGADVDNGLWATLDKKMDEALRGSTPEEVAQNMTFAALTFLFDLIGNWADHHRKEAKRCKKEYETKVANYDHNMGVEPIHKNLAAWAVIANHPAIRDVIGNGVLDKAARKKVAKLIKNDPKAQQAISYIVDSMTMRKHEKGELNKIITNTLNMELGGATLDDVKGAALDQDVIVRAANRAGIRLQAEDTHRTVAGHEEEVARHRANRETLDAARTSGRPTPAPERTPERTATPER